jgi:hypothetical protein
MPLRSPIDPFCHLYIDRSELRSVTTILPRLTWSQCNRCIKAQRNLVASLITDYGRGYFVSYTLAIQPYYVWYNSLPKLLIKEEVIYEVILEQLRDQYYRFSLGPFPMASSKKSLTGEMTHRRTNHHQHQTHSS